MLVDADCIEPAGSRVLQLIHEVVEHVMRTTGVEQRRVDVHPHRWMLLTEIIRQFCVRHEVEPHEFHDCRCLPWRRSCNTMCMLCATASGPDRDSRCRATSRHSLVAFFAL